MESRPEAARAVRRSRREPGSTADFTRHASLVQGVKMKPGQPAAAPAPPGSLST